MSAKEIGILVYCVVVSIFGCHAFYRAWQETRNEPRKNPPRRRNFKGITDKFEEFNNHPATKIVEIPGQLPDEWALMGDCERIVYISRKEGKKISYYHDFGEESGKLPKCYTNAKGDKILIMGGNFRVGEWIID
jgi:hypothetical protein